eukprot:CAMPEP_0198655988 /NCGR_PEP_ID=MMETSP1467-20131203/8703_1 /TAXON_ID=1462469 /ORGANISM="unid. sp., Strain CCMP2135" /LENGTH=305 /DNA_ID=CAMNT_0044392001 /DNA_START=73 /DNA_END=990 /DNA_ORIENTATION=-
MMLSTKAFVTTFFAATAMNFACELSPAWQGLSFDGNPGVQEFSISYQGCGQAEAWQSMVCQLLPDENGNLNGGFMNPAPQSAFPGVTMDPTGRTLTFHSFTGFHAQGDVHMSVYIERAPSSIRCDFVGSAAEVDFTDPNAPTGAPVELPETRAPTATPRPTPQPTFAPTPSPTTSEPTLAPTEECPCYADTSAGGQLWKDLVDGTMDASNIKMCSFNTPNDFVPGTSRSFTVKLNSPSGETLYARDWGISSHYCKSSTMEIHTSPALANRCIMALYNSLVNNYGFELHWDFTADTPLDEYCVYSP